MAKKRIYQLARDYKISSEAMLTIVRELGFEIKSHMGAVDEKMAAAIEGKFQKEREAVAVEYAEKKRKLSERKKKEEQQAVTVAPTTRTEETKLLRKEHLRKLEKKRVEGRRKRTGPAKVKHERKIDKAEIQQSVKKTLASMEGVRAGRKYKRRTQTDHLEKEAEPTNLLRVTEYISVAELANLMGVKPTEVITKCLELGLVATINQRLDIASIETIALEFGFNVEPVKEIGVEDEEEADSEDQMMPRAPVITIMGHVDHGKTSLLDYIRKSNIIAGEWGGITQHIGAYEVEVAGGRITFLDTPGHSAFTAMRARGAQVTDIVVLVVAADDSVMPQTVEAIDHARAAGVPIIVAINKMDLPGAKSETVKNQLAKLNLVPEEWGGSTIMVEISAKTGMGVDKLLEMILLQAEIMELKANPHRRTLGVVIESELNKGRGVIATVLVAKGSLRVGDPFVAGAYHGRVRAMFNERGNPVIEAGPSTPVQVLGSSGVPLAGDSFVVTESESESREISSKRLRLKREHDLRQVRRVSLTDVYGQMEEGKIRELKLILKGDVGGSVEALSDTLEKLSTSEVKVVVIHKGVGPITESDVLLGEASDAIIIGFHVRPDLRARELAVKEHVDIRLYDVIYEIESNVKKALEGLLEPEISETISATAEVKDIFKVSNVGQVAGCFVQDGTIHRGDKVRVVRNGVVAYDGVMSSLKRFKDDVREVSSGMECGVKIEDFNDVKVGDVLEFYQLQELARKLE